MDLSGAVIAGGKSRRMGRDKRLLALQGRTLLERAVELLQGLCGEVLFVSPTPPPMLLPAAHVADRFQGLGVLGGIHAALASARGGRVLCIPADTPLLTEAWLKALAEGCGESGLPCVPRIGGRIHPVPGCYPRAVLAPVEKALAEGRAAAKLLLQETGARFLGGEEAAAAGCELSALTNVNTPQEWEALLTSLEVAGN